MQSDQARLTALELEIERATDRLRKAKLAFREAKALVKVARKSRKQLRKELVRLQEEAGSDGEVAPSLKSSGRNVPDLTLKVADSPEKTRKPRKKSTPVPPLQADTLLDGPSQIADVGPKL